jgi:transcriptional regulator with XRE-family HTH domain
MIVRKLRLRRGWSQEQLAELAGVSIRTVQRAERGGSMSLETVNALAAVFEIDRTTLAPGDTDMNTNDPTGPVTDDERDAIRYVKELKEFYSHLAFYLIFVAASAVATGFQETWVIWGALGWGIGVVLHGWVAHEMFNFFGPAWEKRQIEKRLGRKL